jgi:conjugative relaxase-like TrwC/TraI family protein
MLTISPIYESKAEEVGREWFQPELRAERLVLYAGWLGAGAKELALGPQVSQSQFENLLAGRSPDGTRSLLSAANPPRPELGWEVTIPAGQTLSVLWALAPPEARLAIERAHTNAAGGTLQLLESELAGLDILTHRLREPRVGNLAAVFLSGAEGSGQSPHLCTTAFVFNLAFRPDEPVRTFTNEEVLSRQALMRIASQSFHRSYLRQYVGAFEFAPAADLWLTGVPHELVKRFSMASPPAAANARSLAQIAPTTPPLRGKQLFVHWRAQATIRERRDTMKMLVQAVLKKKVAEIADRTRQIWQQGRDRIQKARDSLHRLVGHPKRASKQTQPRAQSQARKKAKQRHTHSQ